MEPKEIRKSLAAAFGHLPKADLLRLKHHLAVKTPIVCSAAIWTDGAGGG